MVLQCEVSAKRNIKLIRIGTVSGYNRDLNETNLQLRAILGGNFKLS